MSKERAIGGTIFIVCLTVAIFYATTLFHPQWLETLGLHLVESSVKFWTIAIPVLIAFLAIMIIGAWIGWTMVTTPSPKRIEEVDEEVERINNEIEKIRDEIEEGKESDK